MLTSVGLELTYCQSALLLFATIYAGCASTSGGAVPNPVNGEMYRRIHLTHAEGVEQRIDLFPSEWAVGDNVKVGSTFVNGARDSVVMGFRPCSGTVRVPAGESFLKSTAEIVCLAAWASRSVAPGDSVAHITEEFIVVGSPGKHRMMVQGFREDHFVPIHITIARARPTKP